MGHIRLGRLPKERVWREVVELLQTQPEDLPGIAAAVLEASSAELGSGEVEDALGQAFGLVVRLAQAADTGELAAELTELGINADNDTPLLAILAELGDSLRRDSAVHVPVGHHRDMASLAVRRALIETVGTQGPSLFGSRLEQLGEGLRQWTGGERFGRLSRLFFGDFVARVLHSAIDRELANHVHVEDSFGDAGEAREFSRALDRYARETAAISERFATDWYAKRRWHLRAEITPRQTLNFTRVAIRKLRADLAFARETA